MAFLSYLISGLGLGSVYAIIALGYSMMLAQGTPAQIQSNPEVIKAYIGE